MAPSPGPMPPILAYQTIKTMPPLASPSHGLLPPEYNLTLIKQGGSEWLLCLPFNLLSEPTW